MPSEHLGPLWANPLLPLLPDPAPAPETTTTHISSLGAMPRDTPSTSPSIRQRPVAVDLVGSGGAAAKADKFAAEWTEFMRLPWPPEAQRAFIRQWLTANESGVDLLLYGDILKKMVDGGCRGIGIAVAECLSHKAIFVRNADRFFDAMKNRTDLVLSQQQRLELDAALLAQGRASPPIRQMLEAQRRPGGLLEGPREPLAQFYKQAVKVSDDPALVSRLTLALHEKDGKEICTSLSEVWDAGSDRPPPQRSRDARGLLKWCIAHHNAVSDPASRQPILGLLRELLLAQGVRQDVCAAYLKKCDAAFERAHATSPTAVQRPVAD